MSKPKHLLPINTTLREQLAAALAGTTLEQHVHEADARAVADAQQKRRWSAREAHRYLTPHHTQREETR